VVRKRFCGGGIDEGEVDGIAQGEGESKVAGQGSTSAVKAAGKGESEVIGEGDSDVSLTLLLHASANRTRVSRPTLYASPSPHSIVGPDDDAQY